MSLNTWPTTASLRAVVNLHHRPETVRESLGDGSKFGLHLEYVYEPVILGTSGGLDNAREFFQDGTFICVNGKIITDIDLHAAIETHRKQKALATLVLKRNTRRERFSMVETADGLVTRFAGMPQPAAENDAEAPLMFTGIHILSRASSITFHVTSSRTLSFTCTRRQWPKVKESRRTSAKECGTSFQLCSVTSASVRISRGSEPKRFCRRQDSGRSKAKIRDAILWNDVEVENDASVTRSVIGDGVRVRAHEAFEDSVVVRAELVHDTMAPPKALKGRFQDDKFVVPLSQ